jgi:hypothetical protein
MSLVQSFALKNPPFEKSDAVRLGISTKGGLGDFTSNYEYWVLIKNNKDYIFIKIKFRFFLSNSEISKATFKFHNLFFAFKSVEKGRV